MLDKNYKIAGIFTAVAITIFIVINYANGATMVNINPGWYINSSNQTQTTINTLGVRVPSLNSCTLLKTNASGVFSCGSGSSVRPASNSLDFDEFVNAMNLDANTTIASHGYNLNFDNNLFYLGDYVGIGTGAPATTLDIYGSIFSSPAGGDLRIHGSNTSGSGITLDATGSGGKKYSWLSTANGAAAGGGEFALYDNDNQTYLALMASSGFFGLGTQATSAETRLEVVGTASASAFNGSAFTGVGSCTGHSKILRWSNGLFDCGTQSVSATGLTYSSDTISLTAGYGIPLTASISAWESFYDTPSTRIAAGTNLAWSGNTLNATDTTNSNVPFVTIGNTSSLSLERALTGTSNQIQITDNGANSSVVIGFPTNVTMPGALTVTGNLTVNGTMTTINSSTLAASSSFVKVGANNPADTLDLGIYWQYKPSANRWGGVARDATDGIIKLFENCTSEPTTTINFSTCGYADLSLGTIASATWNGQVISDAYIADNITASNYLPLTGGTLTGNLIGTGASFSAGEFTNYASASTIYAGSYLGAAFTGVGVCIGNNLLQYSNGLFYCKAANTVVGPRPASNSLDFDEFVNAMNLDANLAIASAGYTWNFNDINITTGNSIIQGNTDRFGIGTTTPTTKLEVQGTASASYGLFGTLQVAGFASTSYNRIGTSTPVHTNYISATNDLLVSGDMEVIGTASFDTGFRVQTSTIYVRPNSTYVGFGTTNPQAPFHISLNTAGLEAIRIENAPTTDYTQMAYKATGRQYQIGVGNSAETTLGVANDFFIYDANAAAIRFAVASNGFIGIGTTTPVTKLEIQGTASASYLLTGNTLQVGSTTSVSYSRFGTNTTGHSLSAVSDLLITGKLEVDDATYLDSTLTVGGELFSSGNAPTVSSCGTSPSITGNDTSGIVTVGTTGITACTVAYAATKTGTPRVFIELIGVATTQYISASNTTGFTVTFGASMSGRQFTYFVISN